MRATRLRTRRSSHDFPHREIAAAADGPARARRDAGAAVARAMVPAFALRGQAAASRCTASRRSTCRTAWRWSTGRRRAKGAGFELSPILEPLAPYPGPDAGAVGPQGELELHPRRRVRIVSDRHDARRPQRGRDHRRRLDGPAAGAAIRQRDAGGVARAGDGSAGQRRRLHRQSELRLHAHALVAQRDAAAADGVQPARGVREAVRRQRQHRSRGARSAAAPAQEHPRFGDRQAGRPQARARPAGSGRRSTSTPSRFATSSAASRRPRSSATSSCRRWSSRRACRRSSKITWR